MIRQSDQELRRSWEARFAALPTPAIEALSGALQDLRKDARARAQYAWKRSKYTTASYWAVVGVYCGHMARVLNRLGQQRRDSE